MSIKNPILLLSKMVPLKSKILSLISQENNNNGLSPKYSIVIQDQKYIHQQIPYYSLK